MNVFTGIVGKSVGSVALVALPSGCGTLLFPKTETFTPNRVELPASVAAAAPLTFAVHYSDPSCNYRDSRLSVESRTAGELRLKATRHYAEQWFGGCSAAIVSRTLTYTDEGTPPRTGPFNVYINGEAWGSVEVQP